MVTRIVKMSFMPEKVSEFKMLFEQYKLQIAAAEGCFSLRLLQAKERNVFFTFSEWQEEKYLEQYRQSALFAEVWSTTKTFFNAKPEAWTSDILFNSQIANDRI
jgi:quinol monooxygenase YgiN